MIHGIESLNSGLDSEIGGMDYGAVSEAVRRMEHRLAGDKNLQRIRCQLMAQLLNIDSAEKLFQKGVYHENQSTECPLSRSDPGA